MKEVDFYAPEEGQNEAYAENFGDMTVHEVAADPAKRSSTCRTTRSACAC